MHNALLTSNHYEWETPQELFDILNAEFGFDLDPCATHENAKCDFYFTKEENGLSIPWHKVANTVFMNPPYGREIGKWVKKAYNESKKGITVVCLIPARTDTSYWHDYCMKGEIRFIRGRLKFKGYNSKGKYVINQPATFPSAIVIFKSKNSQTSPHEYKQQCLISI